MGEKKSAQCPRHSLQLRLEAAYRGPQVGQSLALPHPVPSALSVSACVGSTPCLPYLTPCIVRVCLPLLHDAVQSVSLPLTVCALCPSHSLQLRLEEVHDGGQVGQSLARAGVRSHHAGGGEQHAGHRTRGGEGGLNPSPIADRESILTAEREPMMMAASGPEQHSFTLWSSQCAVHTVMVLIIHGLYFFERAFRCISFRQLKMP